MRRFLQAGLAVLLAGAVIVAEVARADTDGQVNVVEVSFAAQLRQAWMAVERGQSNREAALLIVADGAAGWRAVPVFDEHGYQTIRLEIPRGTLAILHTHPNHLGGEPSIADRRNSDLLGIPNFTLTDRGVWRYDPRTRRTERVMYKLSWLEAGNWEKLLAASEGTWQ